MDFMLGIYRYISLRLGRKLLEESKEISLGMREMGRDPKMSCRLEKIGKYLVGKEDGVSGNRISMGRLYRQNKRKGASVEGIM
jgi:hypothetical protein